MGVVPNEPSVINEAVLLDRGWCNVLHGVSNRRVDDCVKYGDTTELYKTPPRLWLWHSWYELGVQNIEMRRQVPGVEWSTSWPSAWVLFNVLINV